MMEGKANTPAARSQDGAGAPFLFRRRLAAVAADREAHVELDDDFHGFRLAVRHDGASVLAIDAATYRHPWTSCAGATARLQDLVGAPLRGNIFDIMDGQPVREHCTHLFDMAGLAIVAAATGRSRRYDIRADIFDPERMTIALDTDGERRLTWGIANGEIVEPAAFAGCSVRGGFAAWARTEESDTRQLELFLLRRAVMLASGRAVGGLEARSPAEMPAKRGACFAFQPRRLDEGRRVPGWAASVAARGKAAGTRA
jgi:hypothetical protein